MSLDCWWASPGWSHRACPTSASARLFGGHAAPIVGPATADAARGTCRGGVVWPFTVMACCTHQGIFFIMVTAFAQIVPRATTPSCAAPAPPPDFAIAGWRPARPGVATATWFVLGALVLVKDGAAALALRADGHQAPAARCRSDHPTAASPTPSSWRAAGRAGGLPLRGAIPGFCRITILARQRQHFGVSALGGLGPGRSSTGAFAFVLLSEGSRR